MRPRDRDLAGQLDSGLRTFDREGRPLPGINNPENCCAFIEQLLESIHRVRFISVLSTRELSARRADPNDELFDPLKAAILHQRQGNIEEAFWLVFLFVHFGKHPRAGWHYAREVYGRLGEGNQWDWASTSADPTGFRAWLDAHQEDLKPDGTPSCFGNHRKYESLDAYSPNGTGTTVESYVSWVAPPRTQQQLMEQALGDAAGDSRQAFDYLYRSMNAVTRFGRLARFDYLTLVGKLGLAAIQPGSTYMQGAPGPVRGARLLFGVNDHAKVLDAWLVELDANLNVGMQVLEDALCNWQKSPEEFVPFRG